jgi:hypothetical protein
MKEKTEAAKAMHCKRNGRWGVGLLLYNEQDLGCGIQSKLQNLDPITVYKRDRKSTAQQTEVQG